ncbi:MAG: diaminopimelate decarboxylase [Phycisphaerales bacterium]
MDSFAYRGGVLHAEEVAARDLADRFGTPLFVYSRATLEGHYDRLAAAFAELRPLICYSIKSCPNIHVCRVLVERGSGMDVVSGGELERAWLAGCPMERVVYAGVGKTEPEIRAAMDGRWSLLKAGRDGETERRRYAGHEPAATRGPIALFNIESEPEFEVVARIAKELGVVAHGALRINPDVDPHTHAYTSTGKKETKFGVDLARAVKFFERNGRDEWLRLDALHLHIGSPVYETGPYVEAIGKTLALIDDLERRGFPIRTLDVGGGFAADYETERSPRATDYAAAIVPLLRDRVARGLKIILEPGRQISANAGVLLARVQYVKEGGDGKRFIITDAGMHTLIRPALYGSFHFIWPAEVAPGLVPARRVETPDLPGLVPCDVVGPICESADFLAKGRMLPPVSRGHVLAVFGAGAYGMSMASRYNSHPLPAEVLVSGRDARVVRRRESVADLLWHETAEG